MELVWILVTSVLTYHTVSSLPLQDSFTEDKPSLPLHTAFLHTDFKSEFHSSRVMFTEHKPSVPPFAETHTFDDNQIALLRDIADETQSAADDDDNHGRQKRSADSTMVMPACESVSEWVQKSTAEDMWGNSHTVLQEIDVGGTRVNQYFYETRCRKHTHHQHSQACTGIDSHNYVSMCMEKYMWVYAKVRDSSGQIGWTLVKSSGSCNCGVIRKDTSQSSANFS